MNHSLDFFVNKLVLLSHKDYPKFQIEIQNENKAPFNTKDNKVAHDKITVPRNLIKAILRLHSSCIKQPTKQFCRVFWFGNPRYVSVPSPVISDS